MDNPKVEDPTIENPSMENTTMENPSMENPKMENIRMENPKMENPRSSSIDNPWHVESIWAFSYLHCPECTFNTQEESIFQHHAVETHPMSFVLFGKDYHAEIGSFLKQARTNTFQKTQKYCLSILFFQ